MNHHTFCWKVSVLKFSAKSIYSFNLLSVWRAYFLVIPLSYFIGIEMTPLTEGTVRVRSLFRPAGRGNFHSAFMTIQRQLSPWMFEFDLLVVDWWKREISTGWNVQHGKVPSGGEGRAASSSTRLLTTYAQDRCTTWCKRDEWMKSKN